MNAFVRRYLYFCHFAVPVLFLGAAVLHYYDRLFPPLGVCFPPYDSSYTVFASFVGAIHTRHWERWCDI